MVQLLLEASDGDPSKIPDHYLSNFYHEYANGDISLVPALSALSGAEFAELEYVEEAVEILSRVNPSHWPDSESIQEIDLEGLLEIDGSEEANIQDFVEDNLGTAEKTERVLKEVIQSVFGEGIGSIRDRSGNYPSPKNNFLQDKDGTFAGTFKYESHVFIFEIAPTEVGWICTYRLTEKSLDNLEKPEFRGKRKENKHEYRTVRTRAWR